MNSLCVTCAGCFPASTTPYEEVNSIPDFCCVNLSLLTYLLKKTEGLLSPVFNQLLQQSETRCLSLSDNMHVQYSAALLGPGICPVLHNKGLWRPDMVIYRLFSRCLYFRLIKELFWIFPKVEGWTLLPIFYEPVSFFVCFVCFVCLFVLFFTENVFRRIVCTLNKLSGFITKSLPIY